jgi:hypothetical protein
MEKLLIPVQLDNYSNRKDKTVSIRFITQEMSPVQIMNIHKMIDAYGYLYFKAETEITQSEKEELDALHTDLLDDPSKTPSRRLRGALYRLWEQDPKGFTEFGGFYKSHMEKLIQQIKDRLD